MATLLDRPEDLTLPLYRRMAQGRETIALSEAALQRVERSRSLFPKHLETGATRRHPCGPAAAWRDAMDRRSL